MYQWFHYYVGTKKKSDPVVPCPNQDPGSFNIRLYERTEFGGLMMDLMDDCPSVMERFHLNNIFSCHAVSGNWLFYEHPHYRGRMHLIRPGEYKRFTEWGGRSARVSSVRRIADY